jgi:hypothetical protein
VFVTFYSCTVVTFVYNFRCLEMSRPRRYTAQQALRLIQQIDDNDSGDSGDTNSDAAESDTDNCYPRAEASSNSTSSSDNESENGDRDGEPLVSVVVTNQPTNQPVDEAADVVVEAEAVIRYVRIMIADLQFQLLPRIRHEMAQYGTLFRQVMHHVEDFKVKT